ncbi:hypothetical protein [Vibrio harveyi]|uniref:hypothetical protein n=1 Tax=Vibrio harveyi TaxID=669 RepID=UPI0024809DF0|nr:hypothetical protein [Vibrio harveyi]
MASGSQTKKGDPALQAVLNLDRYNRQQLLIWFMNCLISLCLLTYNFYKADSVASADRNRDYTATNTNGELLHTSKRSQPVDPQSYEEMDEWLLQSVKRCMTFDYRNYADVTNFCNTNVFSLNRIPNSVNRRGHLFYRTLEQSGIVKTLMDNKTTMTVLIDEYHPVQNGVRDFSYLSEDSDGNIINTVNKVYIYEYQMTFRIKMEGQKLDAPIRYQILVEKMSPLVRELPMGIRSIVSIE